MGDFLRKNMTNKSIEHRFKIIPSDDSNNNNDDDIVVDPKNTINPTVSNLTDIPNDPPVSNDPIFPNKTNEYIDEITLELLMNKTQYKRYIGNTNSKKYSEMKEYLNNIDKYKNKINDVTNQLLNNNGNYSKYNSEVEETFEIYTKALIRYFKMKELENKNEYNRSNEKDDDILFGEIDDDLEDNLENKNLKKSSSFWSNEKIIKRPFYNVDMFSK